MKRILAVLALLCLTSGAFAEKPLSPGDTDTTANPAESCPIKVEPSGTAGLNIYAAPCHASLSTFWAAVESHIAQMQLSDIHWLWIRGPAGKDHLAALSFAWGKSCAKRDPEAFIQAYRSTKASEVLAPSLADHRLVPSSLDNFYPVEPDFKKHPRSAFVVWHSACRLGLHLPIIIYQRVPDN
jgi:hypothetical protein